MLNIKKVPILCNCNVNKSLYATPECNDIFKT